MFCIIFTSFRSCLCWNKHNWFNNTVASNRYDTDKISACCVQPFKRFWGFNKNWNVHYILPILDCEVTVQEISAKWCCTQQWSQSHVSLWPLSVRQTWTVILVWQQIQHSVSVRRYKALYLEAMKMIQVVSKSKAKGVSSIVSWWIL